MKLDISTLQKIWEQLVPVTGKERPTNIDLAEEFASGYLTTFNIIPNSKIHYEVKKKLTDICREIRALQDSHLFSRIQDGEKTVNRTVIDEETFESKEIEKRVPIWKIIQNVDRGNDLIFGISEIHEAEQLYDLLVETKHPLIDKIEALNSLLEENKKQTDKLYDFLKNAKISNNRKEFEDEKEFKKFLDQNKSDLSRLGSTKELMNISNAFIKINPEPKDFNGFIDKLPEQKNSILKLIEKIIDKLFSTSKSTKIEKGMLKHLDKVTRGSQSHSRNM